MLLNVINNKQPVTDNIYLYVKNPFESKYKLLFKERKKVGIENLKSPKALIDYSQTIDDVYEHLEDYNPTKKKGMLIGFYDVISGIESNKNLRPKVTKLFLRGKKLNISQSYFKVLKTIRINATHYSIMNSQQKKNFGK